jgi:adenosylcobinamide-GDP ribazoletransferase
MREDGYFSGDAGAILGELKSALVFLTRLPPSLLGADETAQPNFTTASRIFPLAGAIIGVIGGLALLLCAMLGIPSLLAATVAVGVIIALTGALHEDGLADTADSFGGHTLQEKLAIMDDSRIGTFGAAALIVSILVRITALGAIAARNPVTAALVLMAAESASRAAMVRMWHDLPAARVRSLSTDTGSPDYNATLVALAIALVVTLVLALPTVGWRPTLLASVLAVAAAYGAIRLVANTLGGRTGDTLGACQQVTLAAFLIGAASI